MNMLNKSEISRKNMQEAIILAAKLLPAEEIRNSQHFLDHNEIGIAFAELCGSICEGNFTVSKALKTKLIILYDDLDGDSETFWQEIKLKARIISMKTPEF
jgi:hypothetical protein